MNAMTKYIHPLKSRPFFLFLLPIFFIYSGYNELFGFLSFTFVLLNYVVIQIAVLLLYFVTSRLLKNKDKGAVVTLIISLFTLTYGYIHDTAKSWNILPPIFTSFAVILPLILLLFLGLFFYVKKRKTNFSEFFLFLNILFLILPLSEIPHSVKRFNLHKSVQNLIDFRFDSYNEYKRMAKSQVENKPDIYFLVFDAMASSESLQSQLALNNFQLDTFLREKGFYVSTHAAANYNWTIHSLSTTFNMNYLPNWIAPVMNDPKVYFWGSASILSNSLFSILKDEGYVIKNYQPISFDNPDWKSDSYFNELRNKHYYYKTLPGRVWRDIFWNYSKINLQFIKDKQLQLVAERMKEKKRDFDSTISYIKNSCSLSGQQKFIYGHFMLPHEPYIFNENGSLRTPAEVMGGKKGDGIIGYKKQAQYASTVVQNLVDYIQLHNKQNSIIVIAGDHGYRTNAGNQTGYTFKNLNAIYFPDQKYQQLYDSMSLVNTFRIVLNKSLHTNFPLLKDSSIIVTTQKETIRNKEQLK